MTPPVETQAEMNSIGVSLLPVWSRIQGTAFCAMKPPRLPTELTPSGGRPGEETRERSGRRAAPRRCRRPQSRCRRTSRYRSGGGAEATLDGGDDEIADHFARDACIGHGRPGDDLAVARVDDEQHAGVRLGPRFRGRGPDPKCVERNAGVPSAPKPLEPGPRSARSVHAG